MRRLHDAAVGWQPSSQAMSLILGYEQVSSVSLQTNKFTLTWRVTVQLQRGTIIITIVGFLAPAAFFSSRSMTCRLFKVFDDQGKIEA